MHIFINRTPAACCRHWYVGTNLGWSEESRRDRASGHWYWQLQTPWLTVDIYHSVDLASFTYWGKSCHITFPRERSPYYPRTIFHFRKR